MPACGERERPAADAEHPRATGVGLADHLEVALVDPVDLVSGHREQVGVGRELEAVHDVHGEAEARAHRAGIGGDHLEVEGRSAGVGAVDAEHLADHPELERGDAGQGEGDDLVQHVAPLTTAERQWQKLLDVCPSCHSWPDIAKRSVTAMTVYIVLATVALLGIVAIIAAIRTTVVDGYHRQPVRATSR